MADSSAFWGHVSATLSLDVAVGLYPRLGLPIEDPIALRDALRSAILENRERVLAGAQSNIEALVKAHLIAVFGLETARTLIDWSLSYYVATGEEHREWTLWQIAFQYFKNDPRHLSSLAADSRAKLLETYYDFLAHSNVAAIVDQIKTAPLSEWDLEMYMRHGFDNDDPVKDPFVSIELTVTMRWFKDFWTRSLAFLRAADLDALHESALEVVEKIDPALKKKLVHPRDLQ